MRRAGSRPPALAVLAMLGVVLAGCHSSAPRTASPGTVATTAGAAPESDAARASRVVLHPQDLPAGWTASPFVPAPGQDALDRQLGTCLGLPSFKAFQTAQVHSDVFTPGPAAVGASTVAGAPTAARFPRVSGVVTTFVDDRYPRQDLAAFESAQFPTCASAQFRALAHNGGQQASAITVALLPADQTGDRRRIVGFRVTIAIAAPAPAKLVVDVFTLVGVRLGATVTLTNAGQPPPAPLEQALIGLELRRAET